MAVQQHAIGIAAAVGRRNLDEDQRGASFQPDDLELHAVDGLGACPVDHQVDRLLHVAIGHPVGIEHRRLVGDPDVLDQLRDDLVIPLATHELLGATDIHLLLHDGERTILPRQRGR